MTNTKLIHKILLSSALVILALGNTSLYAAKIKCWKNSDGIRECGNVVPPEYAQKGHDEISNQGIRTKHHERALTNEELLERKRIKKEKKAKQRTIDNQKRQDMVLLNTFANEDEIIMARNGKITSVRTEIRITYKSLNEAKTRLNTLRKKAAASERSGKPPSKKITANIQKTQLQIDNYERFISAKKEALNKINDQFDKDLVRYKELRRPRKVPTNP